MPPCSATWMMPMNPNKYPTRRTSCAWSRAPTRFSMKSVSVASIMVKPSMKRK